MKPYLYHADHPTAVCKKKPTACRPPNGCLQEEADSMQTTQLLSARRSRRHADHSTVVLNEEADGEQTTQRLFARRSRRRADHPTAVLNEEAGGAQTTQRLFE